MKTPNPCETCHTTRTPLFVTLYSDGSTRSQCLECRVPELRAAWTPCADCGVMVPPSTLRAAHPAIDFGPIRCYTCDWAAFEREETPA